MTQPDLKAQVAREFYIAVERLGADPNLLSIIGSSGDTLSDDDVLALLREYNSAGRVLRQAQ